MNKRLIVYILGWVLIVEGAAMQMQPLLHLYTANTRDFIFLE